MADILALPRTRQTPGRGSTRQTAGRRIIVQFDHDTFDDLRRYALARRISFAAAVREAVEFGLIDMAENEREVG